jgi:hypothetical protein
MTDIYEKKEVTKIRNIWIKTVCDWCGDSEPFDKQKGSLESGKDADITIYDYYYNSDAYGGWRVNDLCPACIVKLKDLLEDQGIKITDF